MMRKKICLALSVLFACWLGSAGAQSVVVDGVGADEAAAQRDAVRNAVEQAAGTYLSSRTLVADGQTQLDEIYAQSQGYVTHTEILSRAQEAGEVRLRVRVEVDMSADSKLMSRLQTVAFLDDSRIAIVVLDAAGAGGRSGCHRGRRALGASHRYGIPSCHGCGADGEHRGLRAARGYCAGRCAAMGWRCAGYRARLSRARALRYA